MEVMDSAEPQPLKALEAVHIHNHLLERFNKLKKWQEEQQERLRSIQKLQWQKLHEQQEHIGAVWKKKQMNDGSANVNTINTINAQNNPMPISVTRVENAYKSKESQFVQKEAESVVCIDDDDRPIRSEYSDETSFEELLEKQLSKDRDIPTGKKSKPIKRPFLKKGSGLKKYNIKMPPKLVKKPPKQLISKLKLKKEVKKNDFPSIVIEKHNTVTSHGDQSDSNTALDHQEYFPLKQMDLKEITQQDSFIRDCEKLKKEHQKESVELAEFEMLEEAAHNISFTSESSLLAYVAKRYQSPKDRTKSQDNKESGIENLEENLVLQTAQLEKLLNSVKNRHQFLQQNVEDLKQIDDDNTNALSVINEENDIESSSQTDCSLNVLQNENNEDRLSAESDNEDKSFNDENSWKGSVHFEDSENIFNSTLCADNSVDDDCPNSTVFKEENDTSSNKLIDCKINDEQIAENNKTKTTQYSTDITNEVLLAERYHLQKKSKELEEEIEVFKKENALLISLSKQREEMVKQLQNEKKDFEQFKKEMEKKMQGELDEGRKQLRRERQNFERYQKLKKDHPDKKEREIISTLRQQIETLQNDIKKQENKWSLECRRLQNKLAVTEKERDSLKISLKQLESQRVELLTLLKENQKKKQQVKKEIINTNQSQPIHRTEVINHVKKPAKKQIEENKAIDEKENNYSGAKADRIEKETIVSKISSDSEENLNSKSKQNLSKKNLKVRFNTDPLVDKHNYEAISHSLDTFTEKENFMKISHPDKIENVYSNGDREYLYPSGTKKRISADNLTTTINFYNGDWKQILSDGRIIYYYAETGTAQTIYQDGLQIIEFANGQVETHHVNGVKTVAFGDSQFTLYPDGSEESIMSDGTVVRIDPNGIETVRFSNGEIEVRTNEFKKREYLDGTIKILYADGRQETRYANGRMRVKGKDGDVILDIELPRL
ncbi:centromere protein J-like [Centruroides sculpturatus]|uniref:centromere protein J-like n=1 Tax=Centruroides sculpturatus TaxID=218467 RepID=UPI000C6E73BF|nr:centromere protein J-like [Centruroides sculpturatus]XP_023217117.1 centromere protein J-like [Centruroides sculpturatus]